MQSPVTVRWGHEMEVKDGVFIWSNWAPQDYIAAFQRMITICRRAAPQINVMWSPLGEEGMEAYYPGDDYVDLVGISVFGLQAYDQINFDRDHSYIDVMASALCPAAALRQAGRRGRTWAIPAVRTMSMRGKTASAWRAPNIRASRVSSISTSARSIPGPTILGLPDWRLDDRVTD